MSVFVGVMGGSIVTINTCLIAVLPRVLGA